MGRQPLPKAFWIAISLVLTIWILALYYIMPPPAPIVHTVPMPSHIDVNGTQWRVQIVDDIVDPSGNRYSGFTHCDTRVIDVVGSAEDKRLILWHELSHAAVCMGADMNFLANNLYYNSTNSAAHEGIYHFSTIWDELFRRNPDLAAYLGSKQ